MEFVTLLAFYGSFFLIWLFSVSAVVYIVITRVKGKQLSFNLLLFLLVPILIIHTIALISLLIGGD